MALLAYDGASPFDLNAAKAHGAIAITGYMVGHPGGFNPIDKARIAAIRAGGMGFLPNGEHAADFFATCTVTQARAFGAEMNTACRAAGIPASGTVRVPFSFDFQCPASRFPEMGTKFDAVRAGLGAGYQGMIYGQYSLINWLVANGHAPGKHWLMASTFNEPYNASGPNIAMVQSHDANGNWLATQVPGTDVNTVIDPHALGAWWPAGSPYAGGSNVSATGPEKWDAKDWTAFDAHVWGKPIQIQGTDPKRPGHTAAFWLENPNEQLPKVQAAIVAQEAAQTALIKALAANSSATAEQLTEIVNAAVKDAIDSIDVTVNTSDEGDA